MKAGLISRTRELVYMPGARKPGRQVHEISDAWELEIMGMSSQSLTDKEIQKMNFQVIDSHSDAHHYIDIS